MIWHAELYKQLDREEKERDQAKEFRAIIHNLKQEHYGFKLRYIELQKENTNLEEENTSLKLKIEIQDEHLDILRTVTPQKPSSTRFAKKER